MSEQSPTEVALDRLREQALVEQPDQMAVVKACHDFVCSLDHDRRELLENCARTLEEELEKNAFDDARKAAIQVFDHLEFKFCDSVTSDYIAWDAKREKFVDAEVGDAKISPAQGTLPRRVRGREVPDLDQSEALDHYIHRSRVRSELENTADLWDWTKMPDEIVVGDARLVGHIEEYYSFTYVLDEGSLTGLGKLSPSTTASLVAWEKKVLGTDHVTQLIKHIKDIDWLQKKKHFVGCDWLLQAQAAEREVEDNNPKPHKALCKIRHPKFWNQEVVAAAEAIVNWTPTGKPKPKKGVGKPAPAKAEHRAIEVKNWSDLGFGILHSDSSNKLYCYVFSPLPDVGKPVSLDSGRSFALPSGQLRAFFLELLQCKREDGVSIAKLKDEFQKYKKKNSGPVDVSARMRELANAVRKRIKGLSINVQNYRGLFSQTQSNCYVSAVDVRPLIKDTEDRFGRYFFGKKD